MDISSYPPGLLLASPPDPLRHLLISEAAHSARLTHGDDHGSGVLCYAANEFSPVHLTAALPLVIDDVHCRAFAILI